MGRKERRIPRRRKEDGFHLGDPQTLQSTLFCQLKKNLKHKKKSQIQGFNVQHTYKSVKIIDIRSTVMQASNSFLFKVKLHI